MKIGIIITTFERKELLEKCLDSLNKFRLDNFEIIVVDQSKEYSGDLIAGCHYYKVDFDSGLSYCRNYGVKIAKKLKCDYVIIGSDSFLFNESIQKLNNIVKLLEEDINLGKVGFQLKNRIGWEGWLSIIPNESFLLNFIDKNIFTKNKNIDAKLIPCNICKNFYLATVKSLEEIPYDENLKLMEHEDHSIRYSAKYKTLWTDLVYATYMDCKLKNYLKYRNYNINKFKKILLEKYNLKKWIQYQNLQNAQTKNY